MPRCSLKVCTPVPQRKTARAWKRNPNLNFRVRIFSGGVGVFHVKGWVPKNSVCPLEPGKPNFFGGISRDFAGISGGARKVWKKKICVQFSFPKQPAHLCISWIFLHSRFAFVPKVLDNAHAHFPCHKSAQNKRKLPKNDEIWQWHVWANFCFGLGMFSYFWAHPWMRDFVLFFFFVIFFRVFGFQVCLGSVPTPQDRSFRGESKGHRELLQSWGKSLQGLKSWA